MRAALVFLIAGRVVFSAPCPGDNSIINPSDESFGSVDCTGATATDDACAVVAAAGYSLGTVTCSSNGTYTKVAGVATPCDADAAAPTDPSFAAIDCSGATSHDATCTITATAGYTLGSATCDTVSGTYAKVAGVATPCEPSAAPTDPSFAAIDCSSATSHDTTCTITATADYTLGSATCDTASGTYTKIAGLKIDWSLPHGGVYMKVLGQSGKIQIAPDEDVASSEDRITITMDALRQVDANDNVLGSGGSNKQSTNSFANQDFVFRALEGTTYMGLRAQKIVFDCLVGGTSRLAVTTFIFKDFGELTVGSDVLKITPGTMKFNIELSDWTWCGGAGDPCKTAGQGTGEGVAVELDITMAPKSGSPSRKDDAADSGTASEYDMGGGAQMVILDTYSDDAGATWKTMPAGYPSNSGGTFTLRFPRWTDKIVYDPVVSVTGIADQTPSRAAAAPGRNGIYSTLTLAPLLVALAFTTSL